ncbi:hypothetical protein [Planctomyces sp. SH-PL14]|uniref:hypothetical protein n=1 Tax=Planctomyces sp. SH-PL14 TaxID=1632864 RepID=UPI00078C912C|nr:hypothetical protein [Planctomyces sp. SH-PL14]AMV21047.1 hypothetical protein VT03_24300 [Planctomyces sp. SH-PL14]
MGFIRVMGIVPLGIGLTVLGFLWLTPFNEFGSPPLFFRVFGSFIALAFVLQGGAMVYGRLPMNAEALRKAMDLVRQGGPPTEPGTGVGASQGAAGYRCPNCGASIAEGADVSPSGDVKCDHCRRWFNIHRQG